MYMVLATSVRARPPRRYIRRQWNNNPEFSVSKLQQPESSQMYSTMDPVLAGLVAGILHHLFLQYPYQAKLLTTLKGFVLGELAYIAVIVAFRGVGQWCPARIVHTIYEVFIFKSIYVRSWLK
jgi:predicted membrane protein